MPSAREIAQDSLETLQVYAPGESMTDADAARSLVVLNRMIDSWSNESLTCFATREQSGLLVPEQFQYKIGPNGDFDVDRPLSVRFGEGAAYLLDDIGNRYLLAVVPREIWNLIPNIIQVNANIPNTLFFDMQYPYAILNVYPVPNLPFTVFWDSYLPLTEFLDLSTPIDFPKGYEKAIVDNLAIELARYFPTAKLTTVHAEAASKSKANIKRTNQREVIAVFDDAIISRSRYTYSIYRGY